MLSKWNFSPIQRNRYDDLPYPPVVMRLNSLISIPFLLNHTVKSRDWIRETNYGKLKNILLKLKAIGNGQFFTVTVWCLTVRLNSLLFYNCNDWKWLKTFISSCYFSIPTNNTFTIYLYLFCRWDFCEIQSRTVNRPYYIWSWCDEFPFYIHSKYTL